MIDVCAAVVLTVMIPSPASRLPVQDTTHGKVVYGKWCLGCHGETGAGDGPAAAYMLPRPRNFTGALYKIRTTASGQLPTDADLVRAIDEGLPGSAMPAWKGRLSDAERRDVMAYLKTFSSFFADTSQHVVALKFGSEPGGGTSAEALKVGRQFYDSIGCRKCHGDQGRGDGPSAPTLKDDAGFPIFAADLHQSWRFRGGASSADIYRRLRTGLDGTPMPSFSDLIDQKFLTDEQLWRLAQYVRSLSPARTPEVRDVIHAPRLAAALPAAPDDSVWARVERYWFPLVGQVIRKSRWFGPAVSGVWVQAVHDGKAVAVRVSWDDRSHSPDTTWLGFERRVVETVASDDSGAGTAGPWPDQLAVQFPRRIPDGMERPYFLMGGETDPVYQWRWTSGGSGGRGGARARAIRHSPGCPGRPDELRARGMARRLHTLPCDPRHRQRTSVRSRPGHSDGVLRLGWIQRGARHPAGREHLVLSRPRPTHATAGIRDAGGRHAPHAGFGYSGGAKGPTAPGVMGGFLMEGQ